jgi:hypothetical protein
MYQEFKMEGSTSGSQLKGNQQFYIRLKNLKEQYNKAAKVAEEACQLAKKDADIEKNSFMEAAISAQKVADAKLLKQKEEHEKSAKIVADAAETKFNVERIALIQEANSISAAFETQLLNIKEQFEKSAEIATDIFKLAEEKERYALMEATRSAKKTAHAKLLFQKEEFETAAKVAAEIAISRFDLERNKLIRDRESINESFNLQLRNLHNFLTIPNFGSPPETSAMVVSSETSAMVVSSENKSKSKEEEQHDRRRDNLLKFEKDILKRVEARQEKRKQTSSGVRLKSMRNTTYSKEDPSSDDLSQPEKEMNCCCRINQS